MSTITQEPLVEEVKSSKPESFFQVDLVKVWMMLLVIMDHSFTHAFLRDYASPFWERIAIPMFMVIMGFNMANSYKNKKDLSLKTLYSKKYFQKKMERYVIPYVLLYLVHIWLNYLTRFDRATMMDNFPYTNQTDIYLGYTPFWGPGMWFIPVVLGTILVFPLLYKCFHTFPIITFIMTFAIEIGIQIGIHFIYRDVLVSVSFWGNSLWHGWWFTKSLFTSSIMFLLSGVGLGMWISRKPKLLSINSLVLLIFIPSSILYLYRYSFIDNYRVIYDYQWISGDYHFLTFPWSALIFILALTIFPKTNEKKFGKIIKYISKSTWHILLAQILYFSIWYHYEFSIFNGFDATPEKYLWFYPLNVVVTFTVGILWKYLEDRFYISKDSMIGVRIVYYIFMGLAVAFFIFWILAGIQMFFDYPIPDYIYTIE